MYNSINKCIKNKAWDEAIRELAMIRAKKDFNEEIAILTATICLGIDDIAKARNVITQGLKINCKNYELWLLLGECYERTNINQAFLCFENALHYCADEADAQIIREYIARAEMAEEFCVKKSAIVILSYNSLSFTKACIESIRITCSPNAYELIVVDNASVDGSVDWLLKQQDIKLKCNTENVGFPGGCNQGIDLAEADSDIFLLNNDTIMTENALFWLRMGLYENENVGAAGAVSNCVSNFQQVTWQCNSIEDFLTTARINNLPQDNPYQRKNWLIGFALLLKRNHFDAVGGYLDERFSPGQYEDNDLGLRLNEAGHELLLCRNSFIFHFGSGGGKNIDKWMKLMHQNQIKVQEKWGFDFNDYIYTDLNLLNKLGSPEKKGIKILHIGSGIGATLLALKDAYPDVQVYGIETNENMLRVTPKSLNIYRCDIFAENMPFEKDFFDIIMCGEKYDKLSEQAEFTLKVMEYLKTGGRFITRVGEIKKRKANRILPLVSVIMPCYNHGNYVGKAIETVLNQTYPNIELIVVDNGCTDNSFEVISQYKDRIKIFRLEKNDRRLCSEIMMRAVTGEYVAYATADDEWEPEKIELQMDAFFSISNLQACFTWALYADENMQIRADQSNNVFLVKNRSREQWIRRFIYSGNCLCCPSGIFRKATLESINKLNRGYKQLSDFDQWVWLIQQGEIYVVEKPLVRFRWHTEDANPNDSAPTTENAIRTDREYIEIVLRTIEYMNDSFFREAFKEDFVNLTAENHQELLCEKFFLLKHMAENNMIFWDNMLTFYYNHFLEIAEVLQKEYGFLFEDFNKLSAGGGIAYVLLQCNRTKMLFEQQCEYTDSYIKIAQELSKCAYCNGFEKNWANTIYKMLPLHAQTSIKNLHRLCIATLDLIAKNADATYEDIIKLILGLSQLMSTSRKYTKLIGIMIIDEEFQLFCELIHLCEHNIIDLQEAVIPYIQVIVCQLNEVTDELRLKNE